jgi:hypothetical protein
MQSRSLLRSFAAALLCASPAAAADPVIVPAGGPGCCPPPPCATPGYAPALPGTPAPGQQAPGQLPATAGDQNAAQAPSTDAFAQAPPTGGEAAQSALPQMIGDLGIYGVSPRVSSPVVFFPIRNFTPPSFFQSQQSSFSFSQSFASSSSSSSSSSAASNLQSRVPVTSFGSFKISDNESIQPVDRVFITYNYFDVDGFHGNSSSINREMIGFEKTFFDGRASFELRAPYTQVGEGLGGSSDFDGLSLIVKYAAYRDRETGNTIGGGVVVTVPTGPDIVLGTGNTINPTLIQPYLGYVFSFGRFYVEGFSEIVIPTDNNVPTFIANDIGVGYRLESVPIIPTFEVHTNDATNHQGTGAYPIGFVDSVVLTGGFHTICGHSILTLGVATPVTGPRLDSIEAVAQFNWRF